MGFSWTVLGFLNKFSSFILYFTPAEIAEIFGVMMAFALLEGLTVTGLLVVLSAVLPSHWLKQGFAVNGLVAILIFAIASIVYQKLLLDDLPPTLWLLLGALAPLALTVVAIYFLRARPRLQQIILNLQDRVSIMLFVYVPLGVISLVIFLYRSLLQE